MENYIPTSSQCFIVTYTTQNPETLVYHEGTTKNNDTRLTQAMTTNQHQINDHYPVYTLVHAACYTTKSSLTLTREAFMTPLSTSSLTRPEACRTTISSGATELFPIDTEINKGQGGLPRIALLSSSATSLRPDSSRR